MRPCQDVLKAVICVLIALLTFAGATHAQEKNAGFSFDVYGDSRSMMYLPYKQDQEAQARQLMLAGPRHSNRDEPLFRDRMIRVVIRHRQRSPKIVAASVK